MPKALSRNEALHLTRLMNEIPQPSVEHIAKVKIAAIECRTTKQFCEFLDVDSVIFKHWVNTNIEFRKAYRSWRDHATEQVEQALAKKAIGFTKRTRKQILTRAGQVVELVQEEYFPPDSAAAGMWLKNRNGKEWKDTQQIDVNVQTNIRAWLINAMEDAPVDETEIIDVTPMLIEQGASEDLGAVELVETEDQEAARLASVGRDEASQAARDNGYDPSPSPAPDWKPSLAPDIASLNAKWS